MAPALTEPSPKSNRTVESIRELRSRKGLRKALSSVDNVSTHMEDHNMGLRSAASFLKETQEMEQILGELGGAGELGQVDILQVIKTMEGASDPDTMFPLGGFDRDFLVDVGGSDGGAAGESGSVGAASGSIEEREEAQRIKLEHRLAFLRRRLRMQQARAIGKRAAEIAGLAWTRAGGGVGGVRALMRRLDAAALSSGPSAARNNSIGNMGGLGVMPSLEKASGSLRTELNIVEHHLDSDATASSSGAESNDETIGYNNPYQQPLPISQRALWTWAKDRAAVGTKWSWLQIQIHELEYKIQQHIELHRQVRSNKGSLNFEEVGGYAGPLPGGGTLSGDDATCARVRPLDRSTFRKRHLLQLVGLHNAATRAARPADVRCSCAWPRAGCAVCTGRALPHRPAPTSFAALAHRARLSCVDSAFHAVLSDVIDASPSVRAAGLIRDPHWQQRAVRSSKSSRNAGSAAGGSSLISLSKIKRISGSSTSPGVTPSGFVSLHPDGTSHKRKKNYKSKRGRPPMAINVSSASRGSRHMEFVGDDSPVEDSPVPSPASRTAGRPRLNSSYDIDNIIIPHSVAANTRLEILRYKEIITPKWRVLDTPGESVPGNNGILKRTELEKIIPEKDSDEEDISDRRLLERHQRCEQLERGKFRVQNAAGNRRHHTSHSTSLANHVSESLDEALPPKQDGTLNAEIAPLQDHNSTAEIAPECNDDSGPAVETANVNSPIAKRRSTVQSEDNNETVRPFSPRTFPLSDENYGRMLSEMPENHPLKGRSHADASDADASDSGLARDADGFDESDLDAEAGREDPDDPEWEARLDKSHRR